MHISKISIRKGMNWITTLIKKNIYCSWMEDENKS